MINTFKIKFIKHSEISDCVTEKIIQLKQQHWPYSNDRQIDWINANIKNHDYHLLITDTNNNVLAYMNLVNRKINNAPILGIGNVCVDKNVLGLGVGALLMNISKYYSRQLSLDLILLCKENLVGFYTKFGFRIHRGNVYIDDVLFNGSVMISNNDYNLNDELCIDRDF